MNTSSILTALKNKYPELADTTYEIPKPHVGRGEIKAVILGADPTHIVDGRPNGLSKVFDLDDPKSPYWRGIKQNLDAIGSLSMDNIHV